MEKEFDSTEVHQAFEDDPRVIKEEDKKPQDLVIKAEDMLAIGERIK